MQACQPNEDHAQQHAGLRHQLPALRRRGDGRRDGERRRDLQGGGRGELHRQPGRAVRAVLAQSRRLQCQAPGAGQDQRGDHAAQVGVLREKIVPQNASATSRCTRRTSWMRGPPPIGSRRRRGRCLGRAPR